MSDGGVTEGKWRAASQLDLRGANNLAPSSGPTPTQTGAGARLAGRALTELLLALKLYQASAVNSSDPREQALAQQIFLRCRSVAYELEAAESLHGLSDSDFVGTVAMLPSRVAMGARGGQAATLALSDLRERQDLVHPRPLK